MSITNLDVPWATSPPPIAAPAEMSGVDVLPGYPSGGTRSSNVELSQPWSGQTLAIPPLPEVSELTGMVLSD